MDRIMSAKIAAANGTMGNEIPFGTEAKYVDVHTTEDGTASTYKYSLQDVIGNVTMTGGGGSIATQLSSLSNRISTNATNISNEITNRVNADSTLQTAINGKANESHTHSYLPLSGGTLTGSLIVNGLATIRDGVKAPSWSYDFLIWGYHYKLVRFGRYVMLDSPGTGAITLSGSWGNIGTVPEGFRPVNDNQIFLTPLIGSNNIKSWMKINVNKNGLFSYQLLNTSSQDFSEFNLSGMCWVTTQTPYPS